MSRQRGKTKRAVGANQAGSQLKVEALRQALPHLSSGRLARLGAPPSRLCVDRGLRMVPVSLGGRAGYRRVLPANFSLCVAAIVHLPGAGIFPGSRPAVSRVGPGRTKTLFGISTGSRLP